jgi:hypothetical protein
MDLIQTVEDLTVIHAKLKAVEFFLTVNPRNDDVKELRRNLGVRLVRQSQLLVSALRDCVENEAVKELHAEGADKVPSAHISNSDCRLMEEKETEGDSPRDLHFPSTLIFDKPQEVMKRDKAAYEENERREQLDE